MIIQLLTLLLVQLFVPKKNEPVRLAKKQEMKFDLNMAFILIALAMIIFFAILLLSAIVFGFSCTESGIVYNHM